MLNVINDAVSSGFGGVKESWVFHIRFHFHGRSLGILNDEIDKHLLGLFEFSLHIVFRFRSPDRREHELGTYRGTPMSFITVGHDGDCNPACAAPAAPMNRRPNLTHRV